MSNKINNLKEQVRENRRIFVIAGIIIAALILVPVCINAIKTAQIEDSENNDEKKEKVVELTQDQQNLVNKYNDITKDLIAVMENSKWVAQGGDGNIKFKNNQMIEIKNEQEQKQKFAVCSVDVENKEVTSGLYDYYYTMSLLMESGDYKVMKLKKTLRGQNENAPVMGATLQGGTGLFKITEIYVRASNSDEFNISNWNTNANQFIDNKYDEMYKTVKDYCAKNYPQINTVD